MVSLNHFYEIRYSWKITHIKQSQLYKNSETGFIEKSNFWPFSNLITTIFQGNDSVSECVISNMGEFVGFEPEVYVSYNKGKILFPVGQQCIKYSSIWA